MENQEVLDKGIAALQQGTPLELALIVSSQGSTPRGEGAFMLVAQDGKSIGTVGGGKMEFLAEQAAAELLARRESGEHNYILSPNDIADIGAVCGGDVLVKFEFLEGDGGVHRLREIEEELKKERPTVYLFGGGHVSVCVAAALSHVEFNTVIYDDRADFSNPQRFPQSLETISAPYEELFEHITLTDQDYVLIMTRGHLCDYEVQRQVMKTPACYIGVIGSRAKIHHVTEKLLRDGFTQEEIDRCHTPVGVPIGAETPEEIAVSIAAELILERSRREGRRKVKQHEVVAY